MPTFPALDEEPPPRPLWQVLLTVVGVVVALAAVVVVVLARPWATSGHASAAAGKTPTHTFRLAGRVLELDFASGRLGHADPDGSHFVPLGGDTLIGDWVRLAPDQRAAVTSFGQVVRVEHGRTVQLLLRPPGAWTPTYRPWADGGRRLLQMTIGGGHADLRSVDPAGHDPRPLGGNVNDAVGDPTRDGALVLVGGGRTVEDGGSGVLPTVRLELRTPGHSSPFTSTADLARAIGLPAGRPYRVAAEFSPDGQYVVVTLDALGSGGAAHGVAVLDRVGREIYVDRTRGAVWVSWSHDSRSLAFAEQGGQTVQVVGIDPDARASARSVRVDAGQQCLWSPQDGYLMCDDHHGGQRWLVQVSTGDTEGPVRLAPGRFALAWQGSAAA